MGTVKTKTEDNGKGERTRRRIVETARILFHARGYTNTSMDEIVKKSRVAKGNLYYHFGNKEALGRAVLEEMIAQQFETTSLSPPGDPVEQVVWMFQGAEEALAAGRCKGGCLLGNLALEVSDLHDGLRQTLDHGFAAWERRVEELVTSGIREGVLADDVDARETARFLVATLEGGILLSKVTRKVDPLRSCTAVVKRYLEGLRPPERGRARGRRQAALQGGDGDAA